MATEPRDSQPRDTEFRGNVTAELYRLISACAEADAVGRMEWAIPVLEAEVKRRLHAASLLCRVAKLNPSDSPRGAE